MEPIFVDLNGSTARIDPLRPHTTYMKLSVIDPQQVDEAGCVTHRGQVIEVWITADQADRMADALKEGRMA